MNKIGEYNTLEVYKEVDFGIYLKKGDKVIGKIKYEGMLFDNEIFEEDKRSAYVKTNREDGKLDLILQPIGKRQNRDNGYYKVLEKLQEIKQTSLTSKSNADEIKKKFGLSKKVYKAVLQKLLKENKIKRS